MTGLLARLSFALRHRTLARVAQAPGDPSHIEVFHRATVLRLPRRCPHQGAPLEKGRVEGDFLVCGWHGCRFPLLTRDAPLPADPTR